MAGRLLAFPVSEHDGYLAAVPEPAYLGRVCRIDLRNHLASVLVRRFDPRSCDASRPGKEQILQIHLRDPLVGLARLRQTLAPLRDRLSFARWDLDAARAFSSLDRVLRLLGLTGSRLARDHFSTLLCRGCHLRGLCDGLDPLHP